MYHKIKVKLLSNPQISRLLNGHGVRVSDGNDHDIELSKEQLKKFMKAREKGKAITLNMDPFQMQAHQYLRGSGGSSGGSVNRLKKAQRWAGFSNDAVNDGIDIATRASQLGFGVGGSVNRLKKAQRWAGFSNDTLNKGLDTAARASQLGFGLKKRKSRKMNGAALLPAGY